MGCVYARTSFIGYIMKILSKVPHWFARSYVPETLDFSSWENIRPLFEQLEQRNLLTLEELEDWLRRRSELLDVIGEEGTMRYIRMTCDTESQEFQKSY